MKERLSLKQSCIFNLEPYCQTDMKNCVERIWKLKPGRDQCQVYLPLLFSGIKYSLRSLCDGSWNSSAHSDRTTSLNNEEIVIDSRHMQENFIQYGFGGRWGLPNLLLNEFQGLLL
jgi:hypothetical protein